MEEPRREIETEPFLQYKSLLIKIPAEREGFEPLMPFENKQLVDSAML